MTDIPKWSWILVGERLMSESEEYTTENEQISYEDEVKLLTDLVGCYYKAEEISDDCSSLSSLDLSDTLLNLDFDKDFDNMVHNFEKNLDNFTKDSLPINDNKTKEVEYNLPLVAKERYDYMTIINEVLQIFKVDGYTFFEIISEIFL